MAHGRRLNTQFPQSGNVRYTGAGGRRCKLSSSYTPRCTFLSVQEHTPFPHTPFCPSRTAPCCYGMGGAVGHSPLLVLRASSSESAEGPFFLGPRRPETQNRSSGFGEANGQVHSTSAVRVYGVLKRRLPMICNHSTLRTLVEGKSVRLPSTETLGPAPTNNTGALPSWRSGRDSAKIKVPR